MRVRDMEIGEVQERFANLVWDHEPIPSGQLVKLCEQELNWKKPTTYTVLRKLCEKGLFHCLPSEWFFPYSVPISIDKTADSFIMDKVTTKHGLALSVIAARCHLPQSGRLWQSTQSLRFCQGLSLWESWTRSGLRGRALDREEPTMKSQALKGMRDLLPAEQTLRDYIQGKILETYRASGFERISTPMLEDMENLDKSDGGDNLNLIFKVMKRGDKLTSALGSGDPKQLSDMGLRYDLTLPLSRFYAANKDKLPHPFKVIQTDRVFRAERPQKGRLREFVQCDIDILGDESPNAEVELIDVTARALLGIGFTGFTVNINDRRILRGMLESMGFAADTLDSVCITFDKMDKIGAEGVKAELTEKQLPEAAINALADFIAAGDVTLESVASRCADPAIADDLKYVLATAKAMANGRFDVAYCPSLVRGQGYYTGMVFEITCPQFSGAVAGGGRYDNMIGKFLGTKVPAVGFSIGFERVCGILLEQGYQIPGAKQKIALLYNSDVDFPAVLTKAAQLRDTYNVTVLPQAKKLGKQLGQLEASGFAGAAFMDKDEVKIFAQQ